MGYAEKSHIQLGMSANDVNSSKSNTECMILRISPKNPLRSLGLPANLGTLTKTWPNLTTPPPKKKNMLAGEKVTFVLKGTCDSLSQLQQRRGVHRTSTSQVCSSCVSDATTFRAASIRKFGTSKAGHMNPRSPR